MKPNLVKKLYEVKHRGSVFTSGVLLATCAFQAKVGYAESLGFPTLAALEATGYDVGSLIALEIADRRKEERRQPGGE